MPKGLDNSAGNRKSSHNGGGSVAGGGGSGGGSGGAQSAKLPLALKFLAPEPMAAAIIGKGGAVIAAMRSSCQARLALTEQGEV